MAITVDNSLSGPTGTVPTAASIAARGTPASALASPSTLLYSAEHTVHGLTMIRARTGYHRGDSGRITWPLPAGAWSLRIYVWAPLLRPTVDILERRHLLTLGTHTVVLRESTSRNALLRLQPADLAAAEVPTSDDGSARPINQLLRVEIVYNGMDTLVGRIYAGDTTSPYRENTWSIALSASSVTLSGYRWFKYGVLQIGSTGAEVQQYQQMLIDLGIPVAGGADGVYGTGTRTATTAFQTSYGITPADGIAGPETRSAVELAHARLTSPGYYPPPLWLGEVAIADTAEWIGPAALPAGPAVAGLGILPPAAAGYKSAASPVLGGLGLVGTAAGGRGGPAVGGLGLVGTVHATKSAASPAVGGLGLVGSVHATKSATGTAVAGLGVAGRVDQFVAELAAVGAVATPTGRPAAVATRR